jgi:hypothetical protein
VNLYAVIPSGFRPVELRNLVTRLVADDVNVIIVDTGYDRIRIVHPKVSISQDLTLPKNIQRWWNVGLRRAYKAQELLVKLGKTTDEEFIVAVLNDDVVVPAGFVQTLASALERTGAAAACPAPGMRAPEMLVDYLRNAPRMLGFAFALRGSLGLLADESFGWWYGDNDLDWQARDRGGVVHVGGSWDGFQHLYPDSTTTGELAEQAGLDRQTFIKKWGVEPW